jgi:hypothetical protein
MPPPQQKPVAPILPLLAACTLRKARLATALATVRDQSSLPIMARPWSSSMGVPPDWVRKSGPSARKPSSAMRRVTSWMWGTSPRFSWMTITDGSRPVALAGRARQPAIAPPSPGSVTRSALTRGSLAGTIWATAWSASISEVAATAAAVEPNSAVIFPR